MAQVLEPEDFRSAGFGIVGDGPTVVLRRASELTSDPAIDRLRAEVSHALESGAREVHLDLGRTRSIAVEAVATLLVLGAEAERRGSRVRVGQASGPVRRKLRATGALPYLT